EEGARRDDEAEENDRGQREGEPAPRREGRRARQREAAGARRQADAARRQAVAAQRREGRRQARGAGRREGGLAMTARPMLPRFIQIGAVLLPVAIAACATPPKPRELEAYDLLKSASNVQEASKKSPD